MDVTVLIADDQRLIREGIASLLGIQEGIRVVGTAVNGQDAIDQAEEMRPNVVLMDVRMPVMDGITATAHIHRRFPDCHVLMLTTFDDEEYVIRSLQAGASGYLLKDIPATDLAQAVRLIHAGIYQLNPAVAGRLVGALGTAVPQPDSHETAVPPDAVSLARQHDITERELEVLRLIATGATNREIAEALVVSEGTVKNHVSNLLSRLGLRDRIQAAIYALENGLA